jgi:hypothetical protein
MRFKVISGSRMQIMIRPWQVVYYCLCNSGGQLHGHRHTAVLMCVLLNDCMPLLANDQLKQTPSAQAKWPMNTSRVWSGSCMVSNLVPLDR